MSATATEEASRNAMYRVLLEVAIVATIVIILAGIAANSFTAARRHAHYSGMMAELRSLIPLQETFWVRGLEQGIAEYGSLDDLLRHSGFAPTPGVILTVTAGPAGWSARATHRDLRGGDACAIYVGKGVDPLPPAAEAGLIQCTPEG